MKDDKTLKRNSCMIGAVSLILLILLDQWTKYLAMTHLADGPIPILDGIFSLQYLENRGAAFGLFQGKQALLAVVAVFIAGAMAWIYWKLPQIKRYRALRVIVVLITAGAIGNLIDRVTHNFVVDFFYFELIDFPIFNIADCYVVIAAIVLVILFLFYYKEDDFSFLMTRKSKQKKAGE